MKQFATVMQFEYVTFVKSKSFLVITIIMMLAGVILPMIPSLQQTLGGIIGTSEGERAIIVDRSGRFGADICEQYLAGYQLEYNSDIEQAKQLVADGDYVFAAEIVDFTFTLYVSSMKLSVYNIQDRVDTMVRTEYRLAKMNEAGLPEQAARDILGYVPSVSIVTVAAPEGDNAENYMENTLYAYVMIFLLYFGLLMYGQYVLTSVVREKTTKTMELLITSCKSVNLINGKVLGVGLAGLTQLVLFSGAAMLSMQISSQWQTGAEDLFTVAVQPGIVVLMVLYFLLGFFAYAYVYAALASTVSRMEDANSVATLPMLLIVVGFMGSIFGMMTPGAIWVTVLSYVPFLTPMVMFMRICLGSAAWWEAWLAIALQIGTIVLIGGLSARVYRMGTLMYGKKLNFKDIAAAFKP